MNVSVTIPYYKGEELIISCIESILANSYLPRIIYVVDNCPDNSLSKVELSSYISVQVIKAKPAIGFGRACNIGIYTSIESGDDIGIILNQDAVLDKDAIKELVFPFTEKSKLFASVPIAYKYDFSGIEERILKPYILSINDYVQDKKTNNIKEYYLINENQLNGACVAFQLSLVEKVGLFDPFIKMYGEETELFARVSQTFGLQLAMCPNAKIGHIHSFIQKKGKELEHIHFLSRKSKLVYLLKLSNISIFVSILKLLKYMIHTYLIAIFKLRFDLILKYLVVDAKHLVAIPSILKMRDTAYFKETIKKYLERDMIIV